MEKICVAVRVRPAVNEEEKAVNGSFWKVEDNRISLHRSLAGTPVSGLSYAFDHVLDEECTNSRVYELLTEGIIHAAISGINGTAFAYGQTSSGKTFTMNGSNSDPGIIHRAVQDVFRIIQKATDREFLIRVSYMEIYNEEINDLFSVENQKLQIHESLERGIFVAGLREEIVDNAEQVLKLIQLGEVNRHFGETNMNIRSSRSHTIFRMVIESKGKETSSTNYSTLDDAVRVSVLNLVDLAGSERIAKTGAGGVRLKEGKHINKSLMILGNVINKLSDGVRQRGHIPYRDSKLTRILQPALGGNAKTSIICTVAQEEVHIEETKGTLQFASRAKRITNCVQVNEILTDAALLKRQKLEIEELRLKLQGSHAGVLEQEILKLRNDMLKYELEREKLAMELEEERKSHRERDQCLKEQQMKMKNLNHVDSFSDCHRNSNQGQDLSEESNSNSCTEQGDAFSTPCFKPPPNPFVVRRGHCSKTPEYSPFPDAFGDIADEDTWMKMNKGFVADLDSIRMTPARKVQSDPSIKGTPDCSIEDYKQEVQDLQRQLKLAIEERNYIEKQHKEQTLLNNRLIEELSELQQEAQLIRDVPQKLSECVANCKEIYRDIFSIFQSIETDEKSATTKLLSNICEIGTYLMSTLEAHFSMDMNGSRSCSKNDCPLTVNCNTFCEKVTSTITSLISSEADVFIDEHVGDIQHCGKHKELTLQGQIACWKEKLGNEINLIKGKYLSLEKELGTNNRLLAASKERYHNLEKEFRQLFEERNTLAQTVSSSSRRLALMTEQKEKALQDLSHEIQKRKVLEDEIKQFTVAFGYRQSSLLSFHCEFKSKIENLKAQKPVS